MTEYQTSENDEIEISLADLLLSIWDLRWVLFSFILLGGIVGALLTADGASDYSAKASMIVTAKTSDGSYQNGNSFPKPEEIYLSQKISKTVLVLATSRRVLNQVLEPEAFAHIQPEELQERIQVKTEDETSILWLTLSWPQEDEAVSLLNRLMEVLPDVLSDVMDIGDISVIDYADKAVFAPSRAPRGILLGAGIGLILGCVLGVVYYLFVPKVRGKGSLERLNLDIIGEIPLIEKNKAGQSCYLDEEGLPREYLEAYGRLSVVFRYLSKQREKNIITVTSSIPGEGKSTVAYNLSLKLTETGSKVLLLDFDFKKGFLYQLAKGKKPNDGEVRTESRNTEQLGELLEQMYNGIYTIQGFSEKDVFRVDNKIFPAIRKLKEQFDYILIDTPSVGVLSDVQQIRDLSEGVLFVIKKDSATVNGVTKSLEFLEQAGMEVMGGVLNGR